MKKETLYRGGFYLAGALSLAFGITLSTRAGLGISPITSFAYALSKGLNMTLGRMVLVEYSLMLIAEFLLDGKERRKWRNLLQLPFSVVFSSFLDWFGSLLTFPLDFLWQKLILLVIALLCMGVGVSLTVNPNFVPNPPDGLTQALSVRFRISMGLTKNLMDFTCVGLTVLVDAQGKPVVTPLSQLREE